jgi:hypothetical protein
MFNSSYRRGTNDCLLSVGDSFETMRGFFGGRSLTKEQMMQLPRYLLDQQICSKVKQYAQMQKVQLRHSS